MTSTPHLGALAAVILLTGHLLAQTTTDNAPAGSADAGTHPWSFSLSTYGYIVPHDRSYASPTFTADHGWLHLEARYNYENQETGSLWIGYNLSVGDKLVLEATPMIGGVFGNTTGIAPGYGVSLTYKRFELSTQGEYVFDTKDRTGSFFYVWNELTYSPLGWFRTGLVSQRTRAYHTELDVQRGLLAGFSHKRVDFTIYIFNAGWTDPTVVLALGFKF
jgi:hypothetical protein